MATMALFTAYGPHPSPLPEGEGEKTLKGVAPQNASAIPPRNTSVRLESTTDLWFA